MGCLSFETIFSSFSEPQALSPWLFISRPNFSACCLIWDLLQMLLSTEVWKIILFLSSVGGDVLLVSLDPHLGKGGECCIIIQCKGKMGLSFVFIIINRTTLAQYFVTDTIAKRPRESRLLLSGKCFLHHPVKHCKLVVYSVFLYCLWLLHCSGISLFLCLYNHLTKD